MGASVGGTGVSLTFSLPSLTWNMPVSDENLQATSGMGTLSLVPLWWVTGHTNQQAAGGRDADICGMVASWLAGETEE